ncbi:MAG: glycosyltransferase [Faecalicatena sp.]|uniref:glycosyltransferase n=1 Tax=Faecalicatena sp. TaxID=2005360 RepID=UPI002582CCFB|nr:glycosyltransferase [Faecalicatena sp.]MCI6465360.1 glycosyltransferase [Faecalicatena sp.]MDY4669441.1 glycosyltransferase [Oliverpabstia sp.]MDY5617478.1 glycosyltransferase [Lachnospiraceae bacterium]
MEKTKIKILIIIAGFRFGVSGGVASMLYNYCSHMDTEKFQFDYLALGYQGFEPYREELEKKGSHLYCANVVTHGWKRFFQSVIRIYSFLQKHPDYDIVHANSGAMRQVLMMALAARLSGCKAIIVHSHSAMRLSKIRKGFYSILNYLFYFCTDKYVACSEMAAKSMFPHGVIKNNKWCFLPNAIDVSKFIFDSNSRKKIRKEFLIKENELVIGHVGRFNEPKNHEFLLNIFYEVSKHDKNAVLLLVGTGDLLETIKDKAKQLGILNRVKFVGQRSDVNELLQAMDVFVFPSFFEGLGMSVIEAQASGLPTLASDRIPIKETKITDIIQYLPLGNQREWAKAIFDLAEKGHTIDKSQEVIKAGYDINSATNLLEKIYVSML